MIGPPAAVIIDRVLKGTLNPLVINLYPSERGYSVVFPASDGRKWTTRCFSYENEYELLDDVEKGQLPLFLIDLIDRYCCSATDHESNQSTIYYEGCIAVEIRDFRRRNDQAEGLEDKKHDISYAVLRPTPTTLLNDLENLQYGFLCMEKKESEGSSERPNSTESAESVFSRRARFDNQKLILESDFWRLVGSSINPETRNEPRTERKVDGKYKKYLRHDVRARRRLEAKLCLEQHFPMMQWIVNNVIPGQRRTFKASQFLDQRPLVTTPASATSQWKPMMPTGVKTPLEIAEKRLQRSQLQQEHQQTESMDGMELVEEYGIELPSLKQKTRTRIRIYRRCLDSVYVGHLRMERDDGTTSGAVEGNESQEHESDLASECSFLLGSEAGSRSYIRQYLDMVSEGGRRPLTLTRRVPGKPPQVSDFG